MLLFASEQGSAGFGTWSFVYSQRVKEVQQIMLEINNLYTRTYNQTGRLQSTEFFARRRLLMQRLDVALGRFVRARVHNPSATKLKTQLGLGSKSILHHWRRSGGPPQRVVPGLPAQYARVARMGKSMKALGYVSIALDGVYSAQMINDACTDWISDTSSRCTRTQFEQAFRFGGSTIGGVVGGALAISLCFAMGVATGGLGFIVCGLMAGAAGAYAGGNLGGWLGMGAGDLAYNRYTNHKPLYMNSYYVID